jgi:hypothetical protein
MLAFFISLILYFTYLNIFYNFTKIIIKTPRKESSIPCLGVRSNFWHGLFEKSKNLLTWFIAVSRVFATLRGYFTTPRPNQLLDQHQFPLLHRQREFIAMTVYNCVRILAIASLEILTQLHAVYILYFSARKDVRKNIYTIYPLNPPPPPSKKFSSHRCEKMVYTSSSIICVEKIAVFFSRDSESTSFFEPHPGRFHFLSRVSENRDSDSQLFWLRKVILVQPIICLFHVIKLQLWGKTTFWERPFHFDYDLRTALGQGGYSTEYFGAHEVVIFFWIIYFIIWKETACFAR